MIMQTIFLIQLLTLLGVVGYYFYDVMSIGLSYMRKERKTEYDIMTGFKWDFILLGVMLLAYAVGRITFMISAGYGSSEEISLLYASLINIENVMVVLGFVFFIVSIISHIKDMAIKPIQAYKAEKRTLNGYDNN